MPAPSPPSRNNVRLSGNEQGVTIRQRMRDGFSCDVATCTRPIFNEELLAHPLRKRITNQPCCRVREATGRKARDDAYRPRRIGLGSAKCDATGSAVAPAVRCKIFRPASFMVMLHELEHPSLAMKNIQKRCQCLLLAQSGHPSGPN
jgi:hypothetical protein